MLLLVEGIIGLDGVLEFRTPIKLAVRDHHHQADDILGTLCRSVQRRTEEPVQRVAGPRVYCSGTTVREDKQRYRSGVCLLYSDENEPRMAKSEISPSAYVQRS